MWPFLAVSLQAEQGLHFGIKILDARQCSRHVGVDIFAEIGSVHTRIKQSPGSSLSGIFLSVCERSHPFPDIFVPKAHRARLLNYNICGGKNKGLMSELMSPFLLFPIYIFAIKVQFWTQMRKFFYNFPIDKKAHNLYHCQQSVRNSILT